MKVPIAFVRTLSLKLSIGGGGAPRDVSACNCASGVSFKLSIGRDGALLALALQSRSSTPSERVELRGDSETRGDKRGLGGASASRSFKFAPRWRNF